MLSPVAIFCYNRPFHTFKLLTSLSENIEAKKTEIFVFIDGFKRLSEKHLTENVEKVAISFKDKFKSINISKSSVNMGGARNQKEGITEVLKKYETIIVLEDDLEVSKYFLNYMNQALSKYDGNKNIWHIAGYIYPLKNYSIKDECHFTRLMLCWGWATWKSKWELFINDPFAQDPFYLFSKFNKSMRKEFDMGFKRSLWWNQIEENSSGKLQNTWDIFWYSYIFLNRGLCLVPSTTLVRNIGHDGSGIHCKQDSKMQNAIINTFPIRKFPEKIAENQKLLFLIRQYLNSKNSYKNRLLKKLREFF